MHTWVGIGLLLRGMVSTLLWMSGWQSCGKGGALLSWQLATPCRAFLISLKYSFSQKFPYRDLSRSPIQLLEKEIMINFSNWTRTHTVSQMKYSLSYMVGTHPTIATNENKSIYYKIKSCYMLFILLSQPEFNQQRNSTEFEARLHSYPFIHPTPHKLNLYTQNWTELTGA
jgi:hypothetical protein